MSYRDSQETAATISGESENDGSGICPNTFEPLSAPPHRKRLPLARPFLQRSTLGRNRFFQPCGPALLLAQRLECNSQRHLRGQSSNARS
jgi:hypothetical protein